MKDTVSAMSETDSNQNNSNLQRQTSTNSFTSNGHLSPTNSLTNGTNSDHSVSSSPSLCSSHSSQTAETPTGALPAMVTQSGGKTGDPGGVTPPPHIITNGQCGSEGPIPQGPASPNNQQHIVHVHVNAGETFSVRVGDQIQQIHGPATVRMVSSNGPPLPMPMQVPPGHMVQQIVDEHGILTHVILSPQPPAMPNNSAGLTHNEESFKARSRGKTPEKSHKNPRKANRKRDKSYKKDVIQNEQFNFELPTNLFAETSFILGGPANGTQYYPPYPGHYPSHPQYTTHSHPAGTTTHIHQGVPPPHIHSTPSPPGHSPNTHIPQHSTGLSSAPINHHGDDRATRQRAKLKNRYDKRVKENYYPTPPRRTKNNKANGDIETCGHSHRSHSPSGGTTELEEERHVITRQLSLMPQPKVTEIDSRSALILLEAPDYDVNEFSIEMSEFRYELLLSEKGRDGKYKLVYKGDATEITLKDLKPATEYFLRVSTLLDDLKGDPTEAVSFITSPCEPDVPSPPKLTSKTKTSIQLKWSTTVDNGSKVSKYILEYKPSSSEESHFTEIYGGMNKTFRLTKLQPSTEYLFRLAALNAIGKSEFCDSVCFLTSGTVPPQPDPPMLSEQNVTSLTISWIKRPSDEDFLLQMEDISTGHGFLAAFNGQGLSHKIKNLKRYYPYRFRLCCKNEEGQSRWSDIVEYSTLPDKPLPPSRLQLKGKIHSASFKVMWDPPKDSGGSDIESYCLEVDDGQGFESVYEGPNREHTCDRLKAGHSYTLRCLCNTSAGKSDYSDCCTLTTMSVPPGLCPSPKLQGKAKATSLHLRWNYPQYDGGTPITEFGVQMILPDNTSREVYRGRELDCIVAGLSPGRPYLFQVKAYNKSGSGPWSESLEVISGPGVAESPKAPTLCCRSAYAASITWEEPVNNGATIKEYRLDWSQRTDNNFIQLYTGSNKSYDLKGLCPATQYAFRVQAINSAGPGLYSHTAVCVTPPSSPSQVVSIQHTATTTTTITVQWSAPCCNGSEITLYNIEIVDNRHGDRGDKSIIAVCGGLTEYTISDLTADTVYRIRIQAVNEIGEGSFSAFVKVATKCRPPNPPRLDCVSVQPTTIKIKWGEGKNPDFLRYTLEMERDDGSFCILYMGTAQTYKVNKLSELTSYDFRIYANNEAGDGPYSDLYTFHTPKASPAPLRPPSVSHIGLSQCSVEWQTCRPMAQDSIEYILQLQSPTVSQEFQKVYCGTATSFKLTNLSPKTEYRVRVCAVRLCNDNNNLVGPYSAGTPFTTSAPEPVKLLTPAVVEKPIIPRQLTDQQWAMIILCGFTVFAIFFAVIAQQVISYINEPTQE